MEMQESPDQHAGDPNANSYLELEETLIPYPDSFDIQRNNETSYLLRVSKPFQYESLILSSRLTKYDNEDHTTIAARFTELVEWYHSTVYNFNDDVLGDENNIIFPPEIALSGALFNRLHANETAVRPHLMLNDLLLVRDGRVYRYILSRNQFILKGMCEASDITRHLIGGDALSGRADEYVLVLSHPRRGAIVYGEKSFQLGLQYAGELSQILISIAGSLGDGLRMRKHMSCYESGMLSAVGLEGGSIVVAAVFELHGTTV